MRKISLSVFAITLTAFIASTALATPMVQIDQTTSAGGDNFAVSLSTGDADNTFNSIRVTITPDAGQFVNFDPSGLNGFAPRLPGEDFTFTNALIAFPAPQGFGFSTVGGADDSADGFSYTTGPLGSNISSVDPLFMNNVVLPTGGSATGLIELIDTGVVLTELPFTLGGMVDDPIANGTPAGGSLIDLTPEFLDSTGLREDAIVLNNAGGGTLEITGVTVSNDALGIFGGSADGLNVDLTVDVGIGQQQPMGTVATADLLIETNGGNLNYSLTATVPEPATLGLIGLAMIGLVAVRRS